MLKICVQLKCPRSSLPILCENSVHSIGAKDSYHLKCWHEEKAPKGCITHIQKTIIVIQEQPILEPLYRIQKLVQGWVNHPGTPTIQYRQNKDLNFQNGHFISDKHSCIPLPISSNNHWRNQLSSPFFFFSRTRTPPPRPNKLHYLPREDPLKFKQCESQKSQLLHHLTVD